MQGIITGQSEDSIDVKIISRVDTTTGLGSTSIYEEITYNERNPSTSIKDGDTLSIMATTGTGEPGVALTTVTLETDSVSDWYDNQTLELENTIIFWKSIAPKPIDTRFALDRNARHDAIHIAIVDDTGDVTGIQGNLLEKHHFLSKAVDAVSAVNASQRIWWKEYLAQYSKYVYAGDNPSDNSNNEIVYQTFFETDPNTKVYNWNVNDTVSNGLWNAPMQDARFSVLGNATYTLGGGNDYLANSNGEIGSMKATLGDLMTSYELFLNP